MMSTRSFRFVKVDHGGGVRTAQVIECRKCGVTARFVQSSGSSKSPEPARRYFQNHGWEVGSRPSADTCPDCLQRTRPQGATEATGAPEPAEAAPPKPREMSRDDRRIIFAKVDEVFLDDRTGYAVPWTDGAVARDLGVPRAWVATVREEFFGGSGGNADLDAFLETLAPVKLDAERLLEEVSRHHAAARGLLDRVAALEATARKVEREIGR